MITGRQLMNNYDLSEYELRLAIENNELQAYNEKGDQIFPPEPMPEGFSIESMLDRVSKDRKWPGADPIEDDADDFRFYVENVKAFLEKTRPTASQQASTEKQHDQGEKEKAIKDSDDFIRNLKIYYVNNEQIKIQVLGKDATPYLYSTFGFRNSTTKQWKTLINILQDPPYTFFLSPDKHRKRIAEINKKLIKFFRTHPAFSLEIPENYKIYEGSMEVSKKYRFKFQVASEVKGTLESKYASFPQDKLIDEFYKYCEKYREQKNKPVIDKKEHDVVINRLIEGIKLTSTIALEKEWLTSQDVEDAIKPDEETYVFNPYENEEDYKSA